MMDEPTPLSSMKINLFWCCSSIFDSSLLFDKIQKQSLICDCDRAGMDISEILFSKNILFIFLCLNASPGIEGGYC